MAEKTEYPEHLLRTVDLVAAVLRRIREKSLDKSRKECFCIAEAKGDAT